MKLPPVPIPGRAPGDEGVVAVDSNGEKNFKISNHRGKYVVLVFYTGDWECRNILSAFNDIMDKYKAAKCEVFGVSSDNAKVHRSWIKSSSAEGGFDGELSIPLISDSSGLMSQQYDVFDPEEGVCRNAVVIIDDTGIVRHAMTTSMDDGAVARNTLDLVAMLKQHQLSDSEVRNINSRAESMAAAKRNKTKAYNTASSSATWREMSPVKLDQSELEKCWDVSNDPELAKVLNKVKAFGKRAPPPVVQIKKEPCFDLSTEHIRRMINPSTPVKACRATLNRNLAAYTAQTLGKGQKMQIEGLVQKMMGVAYMPEQLTGQYHRLYTLNQREQIKMLEQEIFLNAGEIRLRDPGTVKWTEGSGVFINNYENFLIFVNYRDQLRITSVEEGHDLRSVLLRLKTAMESIEEALKSLTKKGFTVKGNDFVHNEVGVFGSGFDLSFTVSYPGFAAEGEKKLKSLAIKNGLTVTKYGLREGLYDVRVSQRASDDLWTVVRRGLAGLDLLGKEELNLRKQHNIKLDQN